MEVSFYKEGSHPDKEAEALKNDIQELALEAAAYHNHYLSADKDTLFKQIIKVTKCDQLYTRYTIFGIFDEGHDCPSIGW